MKTFHTLFATLFVALFMSACGPGSRSSPQGLADALAEALNQGDFEALTELVDLRATPAQVQDMLYEVALDCIRLHCEVALAEIDDEWRADTEEMKVDKGLEFKVEPVGLLDIQGSNLDPSPRNLESFKVQIPYGLVDGQHRAASMRYTPAKLSEMRATSAAQVAADNMAEGIYDPEAGAVRTDFAERATELAADGGEPGAAWQAFVQAQAEAIRNRDPDAYAALDEVSAILYGANDWAGNPVPMELRQRKIFVSSLTDIIESRELGGWQLDGTALLIIEGRNGAGATVRGAQFMRLKGNAWSPSGRDLIEIPEGA